MEEVAHSKYARLVWLRSRQALWHQGTGEVVTLDTDDEYVLNLSAGDKAFISLSKAPYDGDASSTRANDLFDLSLHMAQRQGFATPQLLVYSKSMGSSVWAAERRDEVQPIVFRHALGDKKFASNIYCFAHPRGPSMLWWSLAWFQDKVTEGATHNRWLCRNFDMMSSACVLAGLGDCHLHRSYKSLAAKAKVGKGPGGQVVEGDGAPEYSCTTIGLIVIALKWRSLGKRVEESWRRRAGELILVVVDRFLGNDFCLRRGKQAIAIEGLDADLILLAASPIAKLLRGASGSCVGILDFLDFLFGVLCRPSKHSNACAGLARELLGLFLDTLSIAAEAAKSEDWGSTDHLGLPQLKLKGNRARRVSSAFKWEVAATVAQEKSLSKPQQFLAVAKVLSERGRMQDFAMAPGNAGRFVRENMLRYWMQSRQTFHNTRILQVVLDGSRISGEDLMVVAARTAEKDRGAWLPPQASFRGMSAQQGLPSGSVAQNMSALSFLDSSNCHGWPGHVW